MTRTLLAACAAALLLASPAAAMPTQADISGDYNVDVVLGSQPGIGYDVVGDSDTMDGEFSYMTQAAADAASPCGPDTTPEGLPDDGFFPAQGPTKPGVDLPIDNDLNGDNALQITNDGGSLIDLPDGQWHQLILFAASGDGVSEMDVIADYTSGADGIARDNAFVPDWHMNAGLAATDYVIADLRDRINPNTFACDDANDPGIYGIRVSLDGSRTLDDIEVLRDHVESDSASRLTIFGAVLLPTHPVTVAKAGTGAGTVTSSPSGIDCGSDCSQRYAEYSSVTLKAAAVPGSTFTGWSGACSGTGDCSLGNLTAAKNVTATFEANAPGDPPGGQPPPTQAPPPQSNPLTPPPVGPATVRFSRIASAPSLRGCRGRKRLRVRIKQLAGTTITSAKVTFGRRSKTVTGAALSRAVTFRNVPRRRFRLNVEVTTADGRTLKATKRFRRCRAARRRAS